MGTCRFTLTSPRVSDGSSLSNPHLSISSPNTLLLHSPSIRQPYSLLTRPHLIPPISAVKTPKGFGPPAESRKKAKKKKGDGGGRGSEDNYDDEDGNIEEEVEEAIPEVVTNRMMRRMVFSVGIPLLVGLLFFLLFYYLKVVVKLDVPTWIPFIVSLFFFGSALLGVSYGIVSSSWDPLREGSLLGWNEAQKNWPVFWQSLWSKPGKK